MAGTKARPSNKVSDNCLKAALIHSEKGSIRKFIESLKTPLPKPGTHVPSLDMPCGLLGISGIPPRPKSGEGWGEG